MANQKQQLFQTMLVGVLLYSVVLGFFNDYTDILRTTSYSTTFAVAIVLQLLTYATFAVKDLVKNRVNNRAALVFGVWLVLFLSKFVFLAVIDFIFGKEVEISGFIGLMLIVASLTIMQKATDLIDSKLADL